MTANMWYELGIGFPAARAIFKGAIEGFATFDKETQNPGKFGDYSNNYIYFNSLESHIEDISRTPMKTVSTFHY